MLMPQASPGQHRLAPSDEWALEYEAGVLLLHGGADHLYGIEDVEADAAAELQALWRSEAPDVGQLSEKAQRLVPQLVEAGAIVPELHVGPPRVVELAFVGDGDPRLAEEIARVGATCGVELARGGTSELVVFVRTNGALRDVCTDSYLELRRPHLLLDTAFHHTLSLGPLVFPGDTACLGCLAGRIGHCWGDARPPARPAMQRHRVLLASILVLELEKIAAGDYGLANTTISWSVREHELERHSVYKLPWCPVCGDRGRVESPGSIGLPWAPAA